MKCVCKCNNYYRTAIVKIQPVLSWLLHVVYEICIQMWQPSWDRDKKKKKYCHCPIMIATFSAWKVYVNVTIIMGQIIKILSLSHNVCTFNVWNVTTIMELFVAKGVFL